MGKKYNGIENNPSGVPMYSSTVRAGKTIFVSGQVAYDNDGKIVGKGDIEAQANQVFANMKSALEASGATMDDVVKIGVYLVDIADRPGFHRVRAKFFNPDRVPASTLVIIKSLIHPDLLVEVEAVAVTD